MARTLDASAFPPAPDAFPGRAITEDLGMEPTRACLASLYRQHVASVFHRSGTDAIPLLDVGTDPVLWWGEDSFREGTTQKAICCLYAESPGGAATVDINGAIGGLSGTVTINGAAGFYTGEIDHFGFDDLYTMDWLAYVAGAKVYSVSVYFKRAVAAAPAGALAWGGSFPDDADFADGQPFTPHRYLQCAELAVEDWRRAFGWCGSVLQRVHPYSQERPKSVTRATLAVPPTPDGRDLSLDVMGHWFVTLYQQKEVTISTELGSWVVYPSSPSTTIRVRGALAEQAQPQMREVVFESGTNRAGWPIYINALFGMRWAKTEDVFFERARYLVTETPDYIITEDNARIRV